MLTQLVPLLLAETVATIALASDRVMTSPVSPARIENLSIRVSAPQGVLWQGTLRVAENQNASYSQNLSQASTELCPTGSSYDRSERSAVSFNVYVQNSGQGRPTYRFDASWSRPIKDADCGEAGTRTVQINQAVVLEPGQTSLIEGDAGLRVELTRTR